MGHFAKVLDGEVVNVIVAEPEFIASYVDTSPGTWIQTSYNTHGGVHTLGGTPLRYNFAAVGMLYDADADAFYEPTPFKGWVLNTNSYIWDPPTPHPDDGDVYIWDNDTESWVLAGFEQ